MTEYIIIVCLIAIASIVLISIFSRNLRALFAASSNELAGSEQTSGTSAGALGQDHAVRRHMSDFGSYGRGAATD